MTDKWFPEAVRRPGFNAGYTNGRNAMRTTKMHYTAGRFGGDTQRGDQGYFQLYIPRDGAPIQFAEVDAFCWDSGTWNGDGPGVEFERLSYDEPLTPNQLSWGAKLIGWLHTVHGFPLTLWDGERVIATDCGFINHGSVLGRDGEHADHTDGVLRVEWDQMIPATPPSLTGVNMASAVNVQHPTNVARIDILLVDETGRLVQKNYPGSGPTWNTYVLATGAVPDSTPYGKWTPSGTRFDAYAPKAGGNLVHYWYDGAPHSEVV